MSFGELFLRSTGQGFGCFCVVLFLDFSCRSETLTRAGLSVIQNLAWMVVFGCLASLGWGLLAAGLGTLLSRLPGLERWPASLHSQFLSYLLFVYLNLLYIRLYAVIMAHATMDQLSWGAILAFPLALLLFPLILKHDLSKTLRKAYAPLGKFIPILLTVALVVTAFGGPTKDGGRSDNRPNIVMITIDSLAARHMSLYGYPRKTTPNMDRLAEKSIVFDHCISNSNGTHIGLPTFLGNLPFEPVLGAGPKPLLSRILVANGYDCSFVSFKILDPYFRRTFHRNVSLHEVESKPWYQNTFGRFSSRKADQIWLSGFLSEDYRTLNIFTKAKPREFDGPPGRSFPTEVNLDYIARALEQGGRPKFLWTHLFSVHFPRHTIPAFDNHFQDEPPFSAEKSEQQKQAINLYDNSIAEVDYHIGNFVRELEESGLADNTLLIIGSDHGESLFFTEAGLTRYMHSGNWLNERVGHVPLLIKLPGQKQSERIQTFVQQLDVAPTVLDVLGLESPDSWSGRSVLPFRTNPDAFRQEPIITVPESFFQRVFYHLSQAPSWNWIGVDSDMMAIYKDPYKVGWIQFYAEDERGAGWLTEFKDGRVYGVYNIRKDPDLKNDLGLTPTGRELIQSLTQSDLAKRYRFPKLNGEMP
jgi:sulfatase-like protein